MNSGRERNGPLAVALVVLMLVIPGGFYFISDDILVRGVPIDVDRIQASFEPSKIQFERESLLPNPEFGQLFANVKLIPSADSDWMDVLAADCRTGLVKRLIHETDGSWRETVINQDRILPGPGGVNPVDFDGDGDIDYLVSCIGGIQPTNDLVGRVCLLRNNDGVFETIDILKNVRRVTDAQYGDFDDDGDLDLVVAVFGGLLQGQILYLENDGELNFTDHELMNISGSIHVPVGDFDNDGDLDFAALVSQEEEEVIAFENPGDGFVNAKRHWIFSSSNFDLGTAGMVATDLDQDGDQDFLIAIGDNLELINNAAQPWHGVKWLENKGDWNFEPHQIASVGGIYGVAPADFDGDGDIDVAAVSIFNDWSQENAASVVWLENDGNQNFQTWQVASEPIQLSCVTCGDINNDGTPDIVTGSFHFRRPYSKYGSVDAFLNPAKGK
ncbi:MAG: FG-GAP repeat domain-containing protein [Mariniblastus sp.]